MRRACECCGLDAGVRVVLALRVEDGRPESIALCRNCLGRPDRAWRLRWRLRGDEQAQRAA